MKQDRKTPVRPQRRWVYWVALGAVLAAAVPVAWFWYVRQVRRNFACVVDGRVYRSGQPTAGKLEAWTNRYGLKTVVCLRKPPDDAEWREVVRAIDRLGLEHVELRLSSHWAPTRAEVRTLIEVIETARQPMLLHCQTGVERAGLAAAIAAMAWGGKDYSRAKDELFAQVQYRGMRREKSVGAFFAAYEDYCRATAGNESPGPPGSWKHFRRWAMESYYPYYFHVEIAPPVRLHLAPGQETFVELTITNRSHRLVPLADSDRVFHVAAFLGTSESDKPAVELGPRGDLPRDNLLPGESIRIPCRLKAPETPSIYEVGFDLVEENRTWFARQGSPIAHTQLTVAPPAATPPATQPLPAP